MIKPIPKKALINSCTYKEYIEDTGEGSSYDTAVTLNNVKIDEQKVFVYSTGQKEVIGNAKLFYDLVNSSGLISEPKNESQIIFKGKQYTIKSCDILRGLNDEPHHYEVILK